MRKILIKVFFQDCSSCPHWPWRSNNPSSSITDREKGAELPSGDLFWQIENFDTKEQAQADAGPGLVAEYNSKVWLFRPLARATVLRMARRSPRLVQSLGSRHRNIYFGSMKPVVLKAALPRSYTPVRRRSTSSRVSCPKDYRTVWLGSRLDRIW